MGSSLPQNIRGLRKEDGRGTGFGARMLDEVWIQDRAASSALINPLNPDFNIHAYSHLLSLYVCYRSSGENSLKYQLDLSDMIMSSILVTVISQDKAAKNHISNGQCPGTLFISTA